MLKFAYCVWSTLYHLLVKIYKFSDLKLFRLLFKVVLSSFFSLSWFFYANLTFYSFVVDVVVVGCMSVSPESQKSEEKKVSFIVACPSSNSLLFAQISACLV